MVENQHRVALLFDYMTSEYSNLLLDGIKTACELYNIQLYIMPVGEMHNMQIPFDYQNLSVTGLLTESNIDGILFASGTQMHYLTKAEFSSFVKSYRPIPCLSISVEVPGVPSIIVDSTNAYKNLIKDLVKNQKCKRFGVMSVHSNSSEVKTRNRIIKETLEENGIDYKTVQIWKGRFDYSSAKLELEHYYSVHKSFPFDAVICLNDEMAFAVTDFCREHNISVPDEVCVTGFDDIDRDRYAVPSLSTINQQVFKLGFESLLTLKAQIEGHNVPKLQVMDSKVILRKSTARYVSKNLDSRYISVDADCGTANDKAATEWYRMKNQIYQINRFYSEMQYDTSQEQLRRRIIDDVRAFSVTAFAIVLFNHPIEMAAPFDFFTMPKKAELFAAFDYTTGYDSNNVDEKLKFNPSKQILPPGVIQVDNRGVYVISMFHNTLQYGYIMLRTGTYDISIYDLLSNIISTIVAAVHSFALVNNEHTKFQQKYDKLDIIASTDELTGLANRRGLYAKGQTTLKFAKAMNQKGLIVFSDMDGLKKINDSFGHEAGDKAILAESKILKGNFRSNDIVARIGGDEFVMICPGLTVEAFERIRQQVNKDCETWSETSKEPFKLSVSMGYVEYPSDKVGYQITPLLSEADSMLYLEKRRKKGLIPVS